MQIDLGPYGGIIDIPDDYLTSQAQTPPTSSVYTGGYDRNLPIYLNGQWNSGGLASLSPDLQKYGYVDPWQVYHQGTALEGNKVWFANPGGEQIGTADVYSRFANGDNQAIAGVTSPGSTDYANYDWVKNNVTPMTLNGVDGFTVAPDQVQNIYSGLVQDRRDNEKYAAKDGWGLMDTIGVLGLLAGGYSLLSDGGLFSGAASGATDLGAGMSGAGSAGAGSFGGVVASSGSAAADAAAQSIINAAAGIGTGVTSAALSSVPQTTTNGAYNIGDVSNSGIDWGNYTADPTVGIDQQIKLLTGNAAPTAGVGGWTVNLADSTSGNLYNAATGQAYNAATGVIGLPGETFAGGTALPSDWLKNSTAGSSEGGFTSQQITDALKGIKSLGGLLGQQQPIKAASGVGSGGGSLGGVNQATGYGLIPIQRSGYTNLFSVPQVNQRIYNSLLGF